MSKQRKLLLPRVVHSFSAPIPAKEFNIVDKTSFNGRVGVFAGKVGDCTMAVDVIERRTHKKYGKVFSRIKRRKVHVEQKVLDSLRKGDKVTMHTCRPLSKTKKLSFHKEYVIAHFPEFSPTKRFRSHLNKDKKKGRIRKR